MAVSYNYSSAEDLAKAQIDSAQAIKEAQDAVNKKTKQINKTKNKAKKKKLKASKAVLVKTLNDIKAAGALLPKKYQGTNNVSGIRGSVKTVKIPGDNVFAISTAGIPAEAMEKVFFDSIGATEIINLERHDQINTENAPYQPIADMLAVNDAYNPNKIVSLQKIASMYFNTFAIPFETYEPNNGTGPNNEIVYIENSTGDLIINVVDLPQNFRVEVQVLSFEDILNDTIYI